MLSYNRNNVTEQKKRGSMKQTDENESLISKKTLLEKYSVSYGALYRWKRKGLIPEEWFIKKSTSTGQETFFPAKLICERMELILSQKSDILLDELAKKLSGEEKNDISISLSTEFGEKTFRIRDIKSISLILENGEKKDITETIKNIIEKGD